ncbi:leucine--tRNA ligase CDC60 [Sugiyamaella lignohabitans]|uniref:leucine--tRNA ligase n=1 Tax=Sugiyamaella lignohabitans TaxID=796027 RepID=A0A167DYF8_9ASCO|nr:leucine--tRNA ligase CDC60 [Sugiyamaella lignohabitans]ANB13442.1 leucine--tRNA ligase CDC60 [Sugiyamaella lignohabitans]
MAYPYMNGVLHAGHCFTLSKVEFATGYERMLGKNALFPLGFHCTGMPIKACADKLTREIEQFGENFENAPTPEEEAAVAAAAEEAEKSKKPATKTDPSKFTAKKSKAVAKQGRAKYQFEIMLQLGIPREEVSKFADPFYWVEYFPPLCQRDCNSFGARIDWRRSFVTTNANPYYDSFIRWNMNRLREAGKIKFGKRYTIFSAKDNQPCMDHDRQVGEAVNPQEYTAIKIKVTEWPEAAQKVLSEQSFDLNGKSVYLIAATLRPETMYGQTCCFVSPKIEYGIFDAGNNDYYICTERAFKNMSFQDLTPVRGYYQASAKISGSVIIGAKIKAPLSVYPELRVLPMETVLANKGTGVVTSVPSNSPDDYITAIDLQNKPEYYKIEREWASFEPVAIIETPTYGTVTAKTIIEQLKVKSPKDKDALAQAKELAYKEDFYQGVMVIGKYKGEKVEDAKPKVKADLIASNEAFVYDEPEGLVISRSGDECVVSLQDQWYTDYGEDSWRAKAEQCLSQMNTYSPETKHGFEKVLGWLKNWALSRSYGLGTKIPWDPQYLVESLSDSTIYMAYYTISHFLHSDFYGREKGLLDIKVEEMTDEVWDFVFTNPTDDMSNLNTTISKDKLMKMRHEFQYFYPLDVRVSGKDLIPNHLTFFIYVHTAIFPEEFWPRGIRANGHLMLNNEKMSKSTGNFMTLEEIVKKFGADAARIALADAGDTFEDANFDESNANAAILRLYNLKEWMEEVIKNDSELRTGSADEYNFFDLAFANEMNELIAATKDNYENAWYKGALKSGLFDFQSARDYYRESTTSVGTGMHKELVRRYIEVQALLLTPIAPHFAEYVWRDILGKNESVQYAHFPKVDSPINKSISDALAYVRNLSRSARETEGALLKKKKKGNDFDPKKPSKLSLYISLAFPKWQDEYIEVVRDAFENLSLDFTPDFKQKIAKIGDVKRGMQFVNTLKTKLTVEKLPPNTVFNRKLTFSEVDTVKTTVTLLKKSPQATKIEEIQLIAIDENDNTKGKDIISGEEVEVPSVKQVQEAVPGQPAIVIANI